MIGRASPRVSRRAVLRVGTGIVAGLAVGSVAHGSLYERHHLTVTTADVPCVALPPALEGLRIGLITDTHHSAYTSRAFIEQAVDRLVRQSPDLVVLGGDYITQQNRAYVEGGTAPFARLRPPHGVFGILGNHDEGQDVTRGLRKAGVTVLRDARTRLIVRGTAMDLLGLDYWTKAPAALARLARGRAPFSVLLAHDPRRLIEAADIDLPLVLSGHTHGGQVRLPLVGAIAAHKYPVAQGLARRGRTTLFVSRGVGTVLLPCRIDCPPEIALLTLRTAASAPAAV